MNLRLIETYMKKKEILTEGLFKKKEQPETPEKYSKYSSWIGAANAVLKSAGNKYADKAKMKELCEVLIKAFEMYNKNWKNEPDFLMLDTTFNFKSTYLALKNFNENN